MPDNVFLTEPEYAAYRLKLLDLVRRHQSPMMADVLEALELELFENGGQGCYVFDMRGKRYFDAATGGGVFALGHAHPKVVEAVCAQARKGSLSTRAGFVPLQLELLQKLSEITPGHYSHGYIGSTGTEVIEAALRLARLTTGRRKIIGMEYSYHGMSIAAISLTGIPYCHNGVPSEFADAVLIPYEDLQAAEAAIDEDTAAVILEPVQWAAGCRAADTAYLQGLRRLCSQRGVILILDEIQTGMGHTGPWFASERAQIIPDITIIGKTLSGGAVPAAAIMYNDQIAQAESKIPMFLNSTFAGNPLACAAALTTIRVIQEDDLLQRVSAISRIIDRQTERLLQEYPDIIPSQNGLGLMRCLIASHPQYGMMLSMFLQKEHGILLPALSYNQTLLRLSPPYIASDAEIEGLFAAVSQVCGQLREMGLEGIQQRLAQDQAKITAFLKEKNKQ